MYMRVCHPTVLTRPNEFWSIRAPEDVALTNPRTGAAILRGQRHFPEIHGWRDD